VPPGSYPTPTQGFSAPIDVGGTTLKRFTILIRVEVIGQDSQGSVGRATYPGIEPCKWCPNFPPVTPVNSAPMGRGRGAFQNANISSRFASGSGRVGTKDAKPPAYVKARINGHDLACLLDTGSDVSILPSLVVGVGQIRPAAKELMAVNGSTIPILGATIAYFVTDSYKSRFSALVSDHVHEVMLGIDFLTHNKASWDFVGFQVSFRGRPHPLIDDPTPRQWARRVELLSDVQIPARSEVDLSFKLN